MIKARERDRRDDLVRSSIRSVTTCCGCDPELRELCEDLQNRIVTIFVGAHIKPGDYAEGEGITHVNILRTLEAMYGLPKSGAQQPNAAGGRVASDDYIITDVFEPVPAAAG